MKRYLGVFCLSLFLVSCDDIIGVPDISEKKVVVLAPTNNAILDTVAVVFTWEALEDAEMYHIQVAKPTFEDALQIVKDSLLTGTSFSTSLNTKSYEWRVRAENSGYNTKYTKQGFSIEE
ncbi:hypothetical protein [Changchengzhania lutea]|uniref:hypothetical protein n=1 Tax=Changchengzhania lutea TaxID=2049305 RepID=UPI00115E5FAD|nr:hypothetical protein [Changchengzhania lutea]